MLPDIALIGRARSGKDTVGRYLVENHGYVRVSFADALKEMALAANPIVLGNELREDWSCEDLRLAEAVQRHGWETAKDELPEVRRFLQNLGVAVRNQNPYHWIDAAEPARLAAWRRGRPVVYTDVRFHNEVEHLETEGFMTVSITRPSRITTGADTHTSETELENVPTDRALCNSGTIADLESDVREYLLGM